jgi:hypothetical protein
MMRAGSDTKWSDNDSAFDAKAGMVSHLDRGLDKMREAGGLASSYPTSQEGPPMPRKGSYTDKLGERVDQQSDDFDEIDPKGEGLRNDPGFQQAGARYDAGGDAAGRRGRRPLWGRLRSNK